MGASVDALIKEYQKKYGEDAIFNLGDSEDSLKVERQTTGISTLDAMLNGGLPKGKVIEISGKPGSGKTSLGLCMAAAAQRSNPDKVVVYFDIENSIDDQIAKSTYKLDLKRTKMVRTGGQNLDAEKICDMVAELACCDDVALVIMDSIAAMPTEQETKKDLTEGFRDNKPILLGRLFKRLTSRKMTSCPVVMMNQLRTVQNASPGMDPYYSPGGNSVEFYTSLRMRLSRFKSVENGFFVQAKVQKTRYSRPKSVCQWYLDFSAGIDPIQAVFVLAEQQGAILRRGATYTLFDQTYKGKEAVMDALRSTPALLKELDDQLDYSQTDVDT